MNYINNFINNLYNIIPVFTNKLLTNNFDPKRPALYKNGPLDSINSFLSGAHHIIDNLYLGSMYSASDYDYLKNNNIKAIVNITMDVPNFYENDISYFNINIADNGEDILLSDKLNQCIHFIDSNYNNNILIHCVFGRSRSVSVLLYYLIKRKHMNLENSLILIKEKRPYINPSLSLINNIQNL